MTVNYIRNLKRTMNNSIEDYENGYRQCSEEMWKLIHSLPNIIPEQRERLAHRCRQVWANRRFVHHHPYQRHTITLDQHSPQRQSSSSSCLKILISHSSISNSNNPCSSLSSSSSTDSSNSVSPSSPKLWKPYM